jgi:hypothetical protein
VELALAFNGEVINADAMQMYKGLPIITNKITDEERKDVPHHLLGFLDTKDAWQVGRFVKEAEKTVCLGFLRLLSVGETDLCRFKISDREDGYPFWLVGHTIMCRHCCFRPPLPVPAMNRGLHMTRKARTRSHQRR